MKLWLRRLSRVDVYYAVNFFHSNFFICSRLQFCWQAPGRFFQPFPLCFTPTNTCADRRLEKLVICPRLGREETNAVTREGEAESRCTNALLDGF